jgi:hypothetical protein
MSATTGVPNTAVTSKLGKPNVTSLTVNEPTDAEKDTPSTLTGTKASPCDNVISKLVGVITTSGTSTVPILKDADTPVKEIV